LEKTRKQGIARVTNAEDSLVPQVLQALEVILEEKENLAGQGMTVHLECPEKMVVLEKLELQVPKERREMRVPKVQLDLQDLQDLLDQKDPVETKDLKDHQDPLVNQVHPAWMVTLGQLDQGEYLA